MKDSIPATRAQLLKRAFPGGVPQLWCPPLTHYDRNGAIDGERIAAHMRTLSPYVGGFLIPGSTGDGWELTQTERRQVLTIGLQQARELKVQVLVGSLHPETSKTLVIIQGDLDWLRASFGENDTAKVLAKAHVCGFTICPPRGKELTQESIGGALTEILELGLPTGIYQLPQVTLNEISSGTAAELAQRYENFVFFKDTSGGDAVALSGKSLGGVFKARGAEGDYARWPSGAGGPYDGFLLASANCFARQLQQMLTDISERRWEAARELSDRLTNVVTEMLRRAAGLPDGNAFSNANKAMDHFFAYGPGAAAVSPPRLHAGSCLPLELIRAAEERLTRYGFMPAKGYLES
jgi:dihydrodipicolinate synthase/N-acetylneuraminate lyase